jgi:hypothetical protein
LNLFDKANEIFVKLCGIKDKLILTSSKFSKLATLEGMINKEIGLTKPDYEIIFKKAAGKTMDIHSFVESIEYLTEKMHGTSNAENIERTLNHILSVMK